MIIDANKRVNGDCVSLAIRAAIKRAKRRKSPKVTRDDLLMGLFQAIARFDIVQIGPFTIDLEELEEGLGKASQDESDGIKGPKVAYSAKAVTVFERSARIAKKDNASKVEAIHLLVAFTNEDNDLMLHLKGKYSFKGTDWRAALSKWQPESSPQREPGVENGAGRKAPMELSEKEFFSPDEAAEFLGVHTQTIRGYIRSGKLAASRMAGERALRIQRDDLLALLEPYKPEHR